MNNGNFLTGLTLGALAGYVVSCFARSHKGRKWRRNICEAIENLRENAMDLIHEAKRKVKQVGNEVAEKMEEKMDNIQRFSPPSAR